mgnify:CR=1 FL=1
MAEVWTISGNPSLRIRQWADEYVVYHEQSGDTHLFDQSGVAILDYLKTHTADTDAIILHIAAVAGINIDVSQLQELSLIHI